MQACCLSEGKMFGAEALHWRSLWFKFVLNETNAPPYPPSSLFQGPQTDAQRRVKTGHIFTFLYSFPPSDYFQLKDSLCLTAREGFHIDKCPVCPWTHANVLHPTKPFGEEFPSLRARRTASFSSLPIRVSQISDDAS